MVKIRLRRIGTKGRPFYRVVVAQSTAARNGRFVETIGSYDPVTKPTKIEVDQERALHWLRTGAQPTPTTAYLLNKIGILEQYFQERPNARKAYGFLDKRTAATRSVVDENIPATKSSPKAAAEKPAPTENIAAEEPAAVTQSAEPTESGESIESAEPTTSGESTESAAPSESAEPAETSEAEATEQPAESTEAGE